MPASKAEQVLEAIKALLETVPGAVVDRNSVLPENQHAVEVEVYVEGGDAAARDADFDALLQQIGAALQADLTLGGLAFGIIHGRPEASIEAVAGAPAIKAATLIVTVDYETDTPLG